VLDSGGSVAITHVWDLKKRVYYKLPLITRHQRHVLGVGNLTMDVKELGLRPEYKIARLAIQLLPHFLVCYVFILTFSLVRGNTSGSQTPSSLITMSSSTLPPWLWAPMSFTACHTTYMSFHAVLYIIKQEENAHGHFQAGARLENRRLLSLALWIPHPASSFRSLPDASHVVARILPWYSRGFPSFS
jgi:hypothetical protein